MKCKILKVYKPFDGRFKDNLIIEFKYFNVLNSAVVTKNSLNYLSVETLKVGQEIEVIKNIKNNKIIYVVKRVYKDKKW